MNSDHFSYSTSEMDAYMYGAPYGLVDPADDLYYSQQAYGSLYGPPGLRSGVSKSYYGNPIGTMNMPTFTRFGAGKGNNQWGDAGKGGKVGVEGKGKGGGHQYKRMTDQAYDWTSYNQVKNVINGIK